jgi:1-acyl-sn-glycerol-3-phosphate acyltransferase
MNLRFFRGVALFGSFVLGILPSLMFMAPVYLTVFVPSVTLIRYRRRLSDIISGVYLNFAAAMLTSSLTGTKVYFYSDEVGNPPEYSKLLNDRGSLFLSNHRCHIDWMYSGFCYASLLNQNGTLRFILKSAIRSVPFFGWIMSAFLYIFVKRKDKNGDVSESMRA